METQGERPEWLCTQQIWTTSTANVLPHKTNGNETQQQFAECLSWCRPVRISVVADGTCCVFVSCLHRVQTWYLSFNTGTMKRQTPHIPPSSLHNCSPGKNTALPLSTSSAASPCFSFYLLFTCLILTWILLWMTISVFIVAKTAAPPLGVCECQGRVKAGNPLILFLPPLPSLLL